MISFFFIEMSKALFNGVWLCVFVPGIEDGPLLRQKWIVKTVGQRKFISTTIVSALFPVKFTGDWTAPRETCRNWSEAGLIAT